MKPLMRKEVRLILPAWLGAMVLATLPVWLLWPAPVGWPQTPGVLAFAPYLLGVLLLGITPFGQELNWGTFAMQLSQPVERRHVWRIKAALLAAGLCLAFLALCLASHFRMESVLETMKSTVWQGAFRSGANPRANFMKTIVEVRQDALHECLTLGGLGVLAAFAGGLWAPLVLRQTSAALWVSFIIPMGLVLLTGALFGPAGDAVVTAAWFAVIGAYALGGLIWGKRLFVHWQDAQWTGGIVSLADLRVAKPVAGQRSPRKRKRIRALLRKELQSQQVNLLLAAGLLVLHIGVLFTRSLSTQYLSMHRTMAMTLESFPLLWLALPLLVGSVAVAEERKLGTLEAFQCLSAGRRMQFLLKLGLVLVLGVLLGGFVPLCIERVGSWVGLKAGASTLFVQGELLSVVFLLLLGAAGIAFVSFYASTLSRSTLQALGVGVLGCILASLVLALFGHPPDIHDVTFWRGPLIGLIGLPVMILVILRLEYRNYRTLLPDARAWIRNGATLLVALVAVACITSVTYHRFWELWMLEEPSHQPYSSRQWNPNRPFAAHPKIVSSDSRIAVILPDGRLWLRQRAVKFRSITVPNGRSVTLFQSAGRWHAGYVEGNRWRDVAVSLNACFAVQTDGTLWDLSALEPGGKQGAAARQVGDSKDWQMISGGGMHFTALKSDGTLWQWQRQLAAPFLILPQNVSLVPTQVGSDHDWVAVADSGQASAAVKDDGSIWRWRMVYARGSNGATRLSRLEEPEKWLMLPRGRPASVSLSDFGISVVCDDGSLWVGGMLSYWFIPLAQLEPARTEMVRLDPNSDWTQFTFRDWGASAGLRSDGSFWIWELRTPRYSLRRAGWAAPPSVASDYADWLTIGPDGNAFLSLGRDGSLCLWSDPGGPGFYGSFQQAFSGLLAPSHIKARKIADLPPTTETAVINYSRPH